MLNTSEYEICCTLHRQGIATSLEVVKSIFFSFFFLLLINFFAGDGLKLELIG